MTGFFVIMLAGFAGSLHCVGMCGGFACGISAARPGPASSVLLRNLLYNSGRLTTYVFIGALAGYFGAMLTGHADHMSGHAGHMSGFFLAGDLGTAQRLLACVAGVLMAFMALQLLGLLRFPHLSWIRLGDGFFVPAIRAIMVSRNPAMPMALGVINGFLPCPLVLAFAVMAATSGSVDQGALMMAAFGLGTFPAMLFMGLAGRLLNLSARQNGVRLAGCFILMISVVTLARGIAPGILHLGGHGA